MHMLRLMTTGPSVIVAIAKPIGAIVAIVITIPQLVLVILLGGVVL